MVASEVLGGGVSGLEREERGEGTNGSSGGRQP